LFTTTHDETGAISVDVLRPQTTEVAHAPLQGVGRGACRSSAALAKAQGELDNPEKSLTATIPIGAQISNSVICCRLLSMAGRPRRRRERSFGYA
jgi:hypothetical protein